MLKKSITYESPFTHQSVTEVHHFHISKTMLIELEMRFHKESIEADGKTYTGLQAQLVKISKTDDGNEIMEGIKNFIHWSYGVKDGDRFLKSKELLDDFKQTEAYSELVFTLCTDAVQAAEFVAGIIPHNLDQIASEVAAKVAANPNVEELIQQKMAERQSGGQTVDAPPSEEKEARLLTTQEVAEMDADELKSGLATGKYKLS